MTSSLAKTLLAQKQPDAQIVYGVATDDNTVAVAGSTVAVTLPALSPVVSGDYVAVLVQGADRLILGAVAATAWTEVTYDNSWAAYGGSYSGGAYRKIGDVVYLRGLIASGTVGSTMFTLPAGFRPPHPQIFDVGNKAASYGSCRLSITTVGAVSLSSVEYTGGNGNSWVSLDGVFFSVTA